MGQLGASQGGGRSEGELSCKNRCWKVAGARMGRGRARAGNAVLNRKIGILINTRGLSMRRVEGNGRGVWGGGRQAARNGKRREWRNDDSFRSFRASSTLALMSSLTRGTSRAPSGTGGGELSCRNGLYRNENLDIRRSAIDDFIPVPLHSLNI